MRGRPADSLSCGAQSILSGRRPVTGRVWWWEITAWMTDAQCRGMDPELFHPGRGESLAEARAVCAQCPVRVQCLDWALTWPERQGVWGGTSELDRRRMQRHRATSDGVWRRRCHDCGVLFTLSRVRDTARRCDACRAVARAESKNRYQGAAG